MPNQLRKEIYAYFVDGPALPLALTAIVAITLIPLSRIRAALAMNAAFFGALLAEKYFLPHYLAPGLGLLLVMSVAGLQLFRVAKVRGRPVGLLFAATFVLLVFAIFASTIVEHIIWRLREPQETAARGRSEMKFRAQVVERLTATPGQHLVLVRYSENHDFHEEHVYNGPDIDSQKIVWALDRGSAENTILLDYYRGRTVWLMSPDERHRGIVPYPHAAR